MSYAKIHRNVAEVINYRAEFTARDVATVVDIITALHQPPSIVECRHIFDMLGVACQDSRARHHGKNPDNPLKWSSLPYLDRLILIVTVAHHMPKVTHGFGVDRNNLRIDFITWVLDQWLSTTRALGATVELAHRIRALTTFMETIYITGTGFAKVAYNLTLGSLTADQLANLKTRRVAIMAIKNSLPDGILMINQAMQTIVSANLKASDTVVYRAYWMDPYGREQIYNTVIPLIVDTNN